MDGQAVRDELDQVVGVFDRRAEYHRLWIFNLACVKRDDPSDFLVSFGDEDLMVQCRDTPLLIRCFEDLLSLYLVSQHSIVERGQVSEGKSLLERKLEYRFAVDFRDVFKIHSVRRCCDSEQEFWSEMIDGWQICFSGRVVAFINDDVVEFVRIEDVYVVAHRLEGRQ